MKPNQTYSCSRAQFLLRMQRSQSLVKLNDSSTSHKEPRWHQKAMAMHINDLPCPGISQLSKLNYLLHWPSGWLGMKGGLEVSLIWALAPREDPSIYAMGWFSQEHPAHASCHYSRLHDQVSSAVFITSHSKCLDGEHQYIWCAQRNSPGFSWYAGIVKAENTSLALALLGLISQQE